MTNIVLPLWDGRTCLATNCLALAMITEHVSNSRVPAPPVLVAISNGQRDLVAKPEQLAQLFRVHAAAHLVCVDAGEIYHVLHDYLASSGYREEQRILWSFVAEGRLLDIGLMEQLLALATTGSVHPPRWSLQELAQKYANVRLLDKQALQRLLSSIPSVTASSPSELVAEAISRARGIVEVFRLQYDWACSAGLVRSSADGSSSCRIPALALQVKADVALADVWSNGLRLAPGAVHRIVQACLSARDSAARRLIDTDAHQWLKRGKGGAVTFRPNGSPEIRRKQLNSWLTKLVTSLQGLHENEMDLPVGNVQRSDKPEEWSELLGFHPLLRAWYDLVVAPELGRSFAGDGSSPIRPRYGVLPRLHSQAPDLDMLRRIGVQGAFTPASDHVFIAVCFPDLRLSALAAVCRQRVGRSTLADILAQGHDPCAYAAARLADLTPSDFADLEQGDPEAYERWFTAARTLLLMVPTGMNGDDMCKAVCDQPCLAETAPAKVATWRKRLVEDIYPELGAYLRDDTLEVMAANLCTTIDDLQRRLASYFDPSPPLPPLRERYRQYSQLTGWRKECLKALLEYSSLNPHLNRAIREGLADEDLYTTLFSRVVLSLSGRLRGRVSFSQARSAEYLDLADDVFKSALFAVVEPVFKEAAPYKVVACTEDTILIEARESAELDSQAQTFLELAQRGAQAVLGEIAVVGEAQVRHCW